MSGSFSRKVSSYHHEASKISNDDSQTQETKCERHVQFQNKIKSIEKRIHDHQHRNLNESESDVNRKLNQSFKNGEKIGNEDGENGNGPSKWERIKNSYTEPTMFKMRELQSLVEVDIKGKDPSMSQGKVKKEVLNLSKNIVSQIKKEIKAKHNIHDGEVERKMHQMKVKETVDEHLRLVVQFKQYIWQHYSFYHI